MERLKRVLKDKKGFTLIELIMVIVIIGILAAVAIPMYVDLQSQAKEASEAGTVGGVRAGIGIWHASALINAAPTTWPTKLDEWGTGQGCDADHPFFSFVLDTPITDTLWTKTTDATTYEGPGGGTYTYNTSSGAFD